MKSYVRKLMPFLSCDILAIEKWLCDMAGKGLFYVESGAIFAKLERGEPKARHYKLEYENITAGHMDAEKQAMYEQFGWTVLDDIKTDLVVMYTDEDISEDEITPEKLSALERIRRKHFRLGILYLVMWLFSRNPVALFQMAFGSEKLVVSAMLTIGTGKYVFLTVIGLLLLIEGVYRLIHSARLKKYIKALRENREPEEYRSSAFFCTVMTKLSVPLALIWLISLFIANPFSSMLMRKYDGVYDAGNYDFPLIDEINSDEWQILCDRNKNKSEPLLLIWHDNDLLAKNIYSIEQMNLLSGNGKCFEYTVYYYDMKKELYAQKLMEENTDEILSIYGSLKAEDVVINERESGDCSVKLLRDDTSDMQYLLIRRGTEYEQVCYCGESELSQFVDLYISYLEK